MATLARPGVSAPRVGRGRALRRLLRLALPHLVLILFSAAILLPLLWVLRVSLTDKLTAYKIPPEWTTPHLNNYVEIFIAYPFATWFLNSVLVALASTAVALPLAVAMAYAFARFDTGGIALRLGVLASQMLPPVILVLPLFALFLTAGLLNTRIALIAAHLTINVPFLAWMLVAFFEGEVRQLEEAARVEGATRFQAFVRIAVPVAAPGILAAGLLGFILSWNEFLFALILSGKQTQTLPVGLSALETHRGVEIALLAAATLLAVLPVFLLLPFLRKYLIKGLSLGALK
ncbi:MAG: binding-protein dependent transport system inner rane protein [Geminicoccaceae bacterium]|jgi:multiple sugar transport system permease protein|nr:binding-protein dependent transport system inner rane protein [Geminicoccaceae bacterium]